MEKLEPALARIAAQLEGDPHPLEALASGLEPRDARSLLLYVLARRAKGRDLASAVADYERQGAVRRSAQSARALHAIEGDALAAAEAFEAVALSPVVPHGATYAISGVHPNNVLAAVRGLEVAGDPTVAFALEAAVRRRDASGRAGSVVRQCAVQRVMRMQPTSVPGFVPHFALFALASAGRERGASDFVLDAVREHLGVLLDLLRRLTARGYVFADVAVEVSDTDVVSALLRSHGIDPEEPRRSVRAHALGSSEAFLEQRGVTLPRGRLESLRCALAALPRALRDRAERLDALLGELAAPFPEASFACDFARLEGIGYYAGPCVRISATDPTGVRFPLADGGSLPWTARLLGDAKERFVTSGIGVELVAARFKPSP